MTTSVNRKYSLDNINPDLSIRVAYAFFNIISHYSVSIRPYNFKHSDPVQPLRGNDTIYSNDDMSVQTFVDANLARLSMARMPDGSRTLTISKTGYAASTNYHEEMVNIMMANYPRIFDQLRSPFSPVRECYANIDVSEVCFELLLRQHPTMHSDRVLDPAGLEELMKGYFGLAHGFRGHCPRALHFTDASERVLSLYDPVRGYSIYVIGDNDQCIHTLTIYSDEGRRIEKFQSQLQIIDNLQRAMGKTQNSSISGAVRVGSDG